jgi:hypothetical protein
MLTKDKKVIIFHDEYLSKLTNINEFSQYQHHKKIKKYNHKET